MTLDFAHHADLGEWVVFVHPEGARYFWHPRHVSSDTSLVPTQFDHGCSVSIRATILWMTLPFAN
jgi:hypothetical protein